MRMRASPYRACAIQVLNYYYYYYYYYQDGGMALIVKLHQLFQLIWQHESVPQDFKDASIIHLYKRKGSRQACDNHRGISLLSIAGKILARLLLNRLIAHLEKGLLPESQCGFWKERGIIDMVFAARLLPHFH